MPRAPADDREFYDYIVSQHATEHQRLADAVAREAPESEVGGAGMSVYILALALPTNRALAHEIKALIPIPPHLHAGPSPFRDPGVDSCTRVATSLG